VRKHALVAAAFLVACFGGFLLVNSNWLQGSDWELGIVRIRSSSLVLWPDPLDFRALLGVSLVFFAFFAQLSLNFINFVHTFTNVLLNPTDRYRDPTVSSVSSSEDSSVE